MVPELAALTIAALAGGACAHRAGPVSMAWPAARGLLEQRLRAVQRAGAPGQLRRLAGAAALAGLLAAGALTAYAAEAPDHLPSEAAGVVGSGDQMALSLKPAGEPARTLSVGQEYRDGWKLKALTPAQATLEKGDQTRTVGLNPSGAVASAPAAAAETVVDLMLSPSQRDAVYATRLTDAVAARRAAGQPAGMSGAELRTLLGAAAYDDWLGHIQQRYGALASQRVASTSQPFRTTVVAAGVSIVLPAGSTDPAAGLPPIDQVRVEDVPLGVVGQRF